MTVFTGTSGTDTFIGAADVADRFDFARADLSSSDTVQGGGGSTIDTLRITGGGSISTVALQNVLGIETIALKGTTPIELFILESTAASAHNHTLTIKGSSSDDKIDTTDVESAGSRIILDGGDGNDTIEGGAGRDRMNGGAGVDFFHGGDGKDVAFGGEGDDILHGLDGNDKIDSGDGNDTIYGGNGADLMIGGAGADLLNPSGGSAILGYRGVSESATGSGVDFLVAFDALNDRFDLDVTVTGVDSGVGGTVNASTFDSDMAAAANSALGANHAIVVSASGGDLASRVFIVVDANGNGTYEGGADYVFDMLASLNLSSLSTSNFI